MPIESAQDPVDALMDVRLRFAETAFRNAQELNRAIDTKASALLASVGLLTAAVGILASNALAGKVGMAWPEILRAVGVLFIVVYLLAAFSVTYSATLVYRASPNSLRPDTPAPGMIFPLMIIRRFNEGGRADEELYLSRLTTATHAELLHDFTNQIVEISNIYESKQRQFNRCIARFQILSVLWVTTTLVLLTVIVLLPRV